MRLSLFLVVSLLVLSVSVCSANVFSSQTYQTSFIGWMRKHDRAYSHEEFTDRYQAFKENMDFIHKWNSQESDTVLGLTKFADLTNEEYKKHYLGIKVNVKKNLNAAQKGLKFFKFTGPDSIDWREKGAVSQVKDQGQCGSCWSFSTTGAVEGAHQIKSGNMVSLSEQNLVDCSGQYGNQGCEGGLMVNAFEYIIDNGGIATESSYPYTAAQGRCKFTKSMNGANIIGYKEIPQGEEDSLTAALAKQPVSVAIDASHMSFQLYSSGVYDEPACSSEALDHGVLAVGYGTLEGKDYYIIKNSWGPTWGQDGYIFMSRNAQNQCGVATMASYPISA
ncbi:hypothetical protein DICPUDRAFT_92519 [Dictyostelium purpureum]|uniref:Uncharacterized protein n=1 Tax=Dictyostelium purpureum TaxID=5786 RepID=F0ZT73_DICPU|nr:uncharacterized protein DICPUDRAFT_92519 [Dictyostelium purpureum]EGC32857.1 hypothetical protein DICPUDRAFT_92519 [Dictyostelium purpureum]|eukprot:XP_003290609.1 hypothetical protein DICPUDRAFT_92519 [Dictyostelium purpureum]